MKSVALLFALLVSSTILGVHAGDWLDELDDARAELLAEAHTTITEGKAAEDTEPDFLSATAAVSLTDTAVALHYFRPLGNDLFQVCVTMNVTATVSCWTYSREEIEE